MSKHQFKIGDKVKYKKGEFQAAIVNGHDPEKTYTICRVGAANTVNFEGEDDCCFASRLELAEDSIPETFDYRQALKILAENPEAEILYSANGSFWSKLFIGNEIRIPVSEGYVFKLKPRSKKYQWLYKTKASGQYCTTSGKFWSKEEAEKAFEGDNLIFIKPLNEETL